MKVTYTKLSGGDWGLRITGGSVSSGDVVTVTKKSGDTQTKTINRVIWTGDDKYGNGKVTLASIRDNGGGESSRGESGGGRSSYADYECEACEFNMDAGDMQGCPRHRGNPRC